MHQRQCVFHGIRSLNPPHAPRTAHWPVALPVLGSHRTMSPEWSAEATYLASGDQATTSTKSEWFWKAKRGEAA